MKYIAFLAILALVFSCSKDEEPEPIVVSFTQSEFSFDESEGPGYIEAQLNRPAPQNFNAVFRIEPGVGRPGSAIIYPIASAPGIVEGEISLLFEEGSTTGKFMFSFSDDNNQEDDQLLHIELISPKSPLYQEFFRNATIDAAHSKTTLKIISNEKLPIGNASMKVNGVAASAVNIETFKGSFYRSMDCDMYHINLIFDECSPNFCEAKFNFTFQSLPDPGTVLHFNIDPMNGFNATQVVTTYVKWGAETCYPGSGSISVIEHDPIAKQLKLNFSGNFWSNDGHVRRTYEITNGIINLSLYDFSVCLN